MDMFLGHNCEAKKLTAYLIQQIENYYSIPISSFKKKFGNGPFAK